MILDQLLKKQLIHPPDWLISNCHYLTITGSYAYGINNKQSDQDLYGFCIPRKDIVFPHTAGYIPGYDKPQGFDQWIEHHVEDKSAKKEYDFTVFNIIKFFRLVADNNPNMVDVLFTDRTCVKHCSAIGEMVRDKRKMFLNKRSWHTFKGYAYSQMHKMDIKEHTGERAELKAKFGYDVKYAAHLVRLMLECEQILIEGDLDLRRHSAQLRAIRNGEWTQDQVKEFFINKEKSLENVYHESKLPWGPLDDDIKVLLLQCLEHHYGSIQDCVAVLNPEGKAIAEIKQIIGKYKL